MSDFLHDYNILCVIDYFAGVENFTRVRNILGSLRIFLLHVNKFLHVYGRTVFFACV